MTPSLPVPSPRAVAEFRQLYLERFGTELGDRDALETSMRVLQIHYLQQAGITLGTVRGSEVDAPGEQGSPEGGPAQSV